MLNLVLRHAVGPQFGDRLGDGLVDPSRPGPLRPLAQRPNTILLLGQIGQLEVEAERADQDLRLLLVDRRQIGRDKSAL